MITKFQQGGQAANQKALMQFVQGIAQVLKVDPKQIVQIAQQKPESLNAAVQVFQQTQDIQQAAQAFAQAVQKAKQGAKLQYLNSLKNKCKEGEELVYMKSGGRVCPVCQKKKNLNSLGEVQKNPVQEFKAKCGGKMKKKMQGGGYFSKVKQSVKDTIDKTKRTVEYAKYSKKQKDEFPYDEAKHKALIEKYRKNPGKMTKAQMDSLHRYNRIDPNEEGV